MSTPDPRFNLNPGEPHPTAVDAFTYVRNFPFPQLTMHLEAFASCAIEGNRLAEICGETLRRVMVGEAVSDRYILGLAWAMAGVMPPRARGRDAGRNSTPPQSP